MPYKFLHTIALFIALGFGLVACDNRPKDYSGTYVSKIQKNSIAKMTLEVSPEKKIRRV
jgi:hypothetical protein